jgi:NADH-quinone oxidoreductase subunit C
LLNQSGARRVLRAPAPDLGLAEHLPYPFLAIVGQVEMRYDEKLGRVVYEPVSIEPRVNTPRVVRDDCRYIPDGIPPVVEEEEADG